MSSRAGFFISEASLAFTLLKKVFTQALILYYFDPKCHIWIKTDALGYVIGRVLTQLTPKTGLAGQMIYKSNPLSEIS